MPSVQFHWENELTQFTSYETTGFLAVRPTGRPSDCPYLGLIDIGEFVSYRP